MNVWSIVETVFGDLKILIPWEPFWIRTFLLFRADKSVNLSIRITTVTHHCTSLNNFANEINDCILT